MLSLKDEGFGSDSDVHVVVEDDGVAVIWLNRPDRLNATTIAGTQRLVRAIDLADRADQVRVIILTGRGRAFCAGADLSGGDTFDYEAKREALSERYVDGVEAPRDGAGLVALRIWESRTPVIAAINGAAVGMGATMTLAADIRMAADSARFGFVFARRGITPEGASSWFLPRLVGVQQAAEWLYTGRLFGAEEALRAGLVRSVHSDDELLDAARTLAREIAGSAPISVALTRQLLWRMLADGDPMRAHRADSRAVHATGALPDAREGVAAFLEKRTPRFEGRVSTDLPDVFPGWQAPEFT